jgi:DNA-binding MarR family transcriptional regulator
MAHKKNLSIDDFTRQTVMIIIRIMGKLRQPGAEIPADIELSYAQVLALYALLETGSATMSQLADWIKISHGVATRTVDRLVDKGLVERNGDKSDRRVVIVSLSPAGKEYAEKMISIHLEKMNRVFNDVSDESRADFLDLLEQINGQLEE